MPPATVTELVADALGNLRTHRQRSALALLGIVIGTAAVVSMLSIGHMAQREAVKLFDHMGLDTVVVQAMPGGPMPEGLDAHRIAGLPLRLAAVDLACGLSTGHTVAEASGRTHPVGVAAAPPDLQTLAGLRLQAGRFLQPVDRDSLVAVMGADAAAHLATPGHPIELGSQVRLGGYVFSVIGLLRPTPATAFDPTDFNDAVVVPQASGRRVLPQAFLNAAMVRLRPGAEMDSSSAAIANLLRSGRPGLQIQVRNARQLVETLKAQKAIHARLLAAIGGVSLFVGGLGVMNVMLMSVMERRREIGLRAAVGATPRDIQFMFLVEAATLSLMGGVLGSLLGVAIALIAAVASHWTFAVAVFALPLGAAVATAVGVIFGLYPAIRASRLDPIEALRAA